MVVSSYAPAGAFNAEATLHLAQATSESADKQSEKPRDELQEQAKENEEDEDEYDDDEYADTKDVVLKTDCRAAVLTFKIT